MKIKNGEMLEKHVFLALGSSVSSSNRLAGSSKEGMEKALYESVLKRLEGERVYLDPDLSLIKLSQIVGTNTSYLSGVMNRCFGANFRTVINGYRVKYAMRLLQESEDGGGIPLDRIVRLSGFSSRSVFYDAFYRVSGMTPQCYLKKGKNEMK